MPRTVSLHLVTVLLLILACLSPAAAGEARQVTTGPAPAWYRPLPLEAVLPAETPDSGATRYLLVDTQSAVLREGETLVHRVVSQPLTPGGVSDVSEITIDFDPVYQQLVINHVRIIRNGKVLDRLDPAAIRILQREPELDSLIYDGTLSAFLLLEDVRPGDIVDFAYTRAGSNPVFDGRYFGGFSMGWSIPVGRRRVVIHNIDGRPLGQQVIAADFPVQTRRHGGHRDLVLDRSELPAREGEERIPEWQWVWPQFQVSEFPDWAAVADWANRLYAPALRPGEVRDLADRLAATATDDADYARDALRFVQEKVRYFGVEFGTNSHAPSPPAETLRRRYGDCKDKSALLAALLRARGLDAHPALVSSERGRGIAESLPSPGAFDHVIVTLQLNGKRYWMDPTALYQAGTLENMSTPGFGKALIVAGTTRALTDIDRPHHLAPDVAIEETYRLEADRQTAMLTVTTRYRGAAADDMRASLADTPAEDIQQDYRDYYAEQYPDISVAAPLQTEDNRDANRITLIETYRIPGFLQVEGQQESFEIFANAFDGYLRVPESEDRLYPYALDGPLRIEHVARVTYYEKIDWETEAPLNLETPAFKYRFTAHAEGRTLVRRHQLILRKDHVEPDAIREYVTATNRLYDMLSYNAEISSVYAGGNPFEAYIKAFKMLFGE